MRDASPRRTRAWCSPTGQPRRSELPPCSRRAAEEARIAVAIADRQLLQQIQVSHLSCQDFADLQSSCEQHRHKSACHHRVRATLLSSRRRSSASARGFGLASAILNRPQGPRSKPIRRTGRGRTARGLPSRPTCPRRATDRRAPRPPLASPPRRARSGGQEPAQHSAGRSLSDCAAPAGRQAPLERLDGSPVRRVVVGRRDGARHARPDSLRAGPAAHASLTSRASSRARRARRCSAPCPRHELPDAG